MTIGGWRWHHLIRKSLRPELKNPKTKGCQQSRRNLIKGTASLPPAGNSFDWETIPDCTGAKYKTFAAAYFKHCECVSTTFSVKVTQKSLTELLQMAQSGLNVAFYYISSYFFFFLPELYLTYFQWSEVSLHSILSQFHFCRIISRLNVFSFMAPFLGFNTFQNLGVLTVSLKLRRRLSRYFYSYHSNQVFFFFFVPVSVLLHEYRMWILVTTLLVLLWCSDVYGEEGSRPSDPERSWENQATWGK